MQPAYKPQPDSVGARAIAFLEKHCGAQEVASAELAEAVRIDVNTISAFLASAMHHRLIVRVKRDRKTFWKLPAGATASVPVAGTDEAPPIARIVPAVDAEALVGVTRQAWFPAAIESAAAPEATPAQRAPAPAAGLGWKAPRVPVYLADAPISPAAAEEAAHAISIALAPTPEDDPDFREARRSPAPEPDNPPKGAEAAKAPASPPCERDVATPNDGDVPQGAGGEFRCALWSNGRFEIENAGERIVLEVGAARDLVRYVAEVLSARARASA